MFDDEGNPPSRINNCSNAGAYAQKFYQILGETSKEDGINGFLKNCLTDDYPSTSCSDKCYKFLKSYNLDREPCLADSAFRFLGGFSLSNQYQHVFKVQSQIQQCLYQPPPQNNNDTGFANFLRGVLDKIMSIFRFFNL